MTNVDSVARSDLTRMRAFRDERMIELVQYDDPTSWDLLWKRNITPWTKASLHPTLREAVEDCGIEYPRGREKKGLVPGCGDGRDVIYLASTLGLCVTGLDISKTALERAASLLESDSDAPKDLINFRADDFFKLRGKTEEDKFDLIYDFTFFVAIHPSQRSEWGRQMAALTKPGGYLIIVVFPIEPEDNIGPPWTVRSDHYDAHIAAYFRKVLDKEPEKLPPGWPEGRQHLLVWQRI